MNDSDQDNTYFQNVYGNKMDPFFQFVVNEYEKRISSFLKDVSPDNYTQLISSVNPKGSMRIGNAINKHLSGTEYGETVLGTSAGQTTTKGEYELGK
jgi:hypothetical protein